jgi:hypothetical protein
VVLIVLHELLVLHAERINQPEIHERLEALLTATSQVGVPELHEFLALVVRVVYIAVVYALGVLELDQCPLPQPLLLPPSSSPTL